MNFQSFATTPTDCRLGSRAIAPQSFVHCLGKAPLLGVKSAPSLHTWKDDTPYASGPCGPLCNACDLQIFD